MLADYSKFSTLINLHFKKYLILEYFAVLFVFLNQIFPDSSANSAAKFGTFPKSLDFRTPPKPWFTGLIDFSVVFGLL